MTSSRPRANSSAGLTRRSRWAGTANPHLIINKHTAVETGPFSKVKLTESFRGLAATLERLRVHRQLDEALTRSPDPLHLAAMFGLDPKTAIRYAESARQLLTTTAEEQDPGDAAASTNGGQAAGRRGKDAGDG